MPACGGWLSRHVIHVMFTHRSLLICGLPWCYSARHSNAVTVDLGTEVITSESQRAAACVLGFDLHRLSNVEIKRRGSTAGAVLQQLAMCYLHDIVALPAAGGLERAW